MTEPVTTGPQPSATRASPDPQALRIAARELEATFLSEMLGFAGLGATDQSFGGGIGEEQFGSFLRLEQARAMVASGGVGLAQSLVEAMAEDRL